jgi:hypothetical protein
LRQTTPDPTWDSQTPKESKRPIGCCIVTTTQAGGNIAGRPSSSGNIMQRQSLMLCTYVSTPHPHLIVDEILPPAQYEALRFPDHLIRPETDWGLTSSDATYESALSAPGWRTIHDTLRSAAFVGDVLRQFRNDMLVEGCLVETENARLIPYTETRDEKHRAVLAERGDPNELFTRLDFQSKGLGAYREFIHLDWARRVVGGILFFSDADEEGLQGGELALYRDRDFRNDRWCHDPELLVQFRPRHNSGVIFLNSNRGFHGPRGITQLRGRRRWLYYAISSRVDVWPHASRVAI